MSTITETITWHPAADGLPDDAKRTVLLALEGEGTCEGFLDGAEDGFPIWRGVDAISLGGYRVTHWASMPNGPTT